MPLQIDADSMLIYELLSLGAQLFESRFVILLLRDARILDVEADSLRFLEFFDEMLSLLIELSIFFRELTAQGDHLFCQLRFWS
jgi:hypothetical protein